jgi:hypothetical protein
MLEYDVVISTIRTKRSGEKQNVKKYTVGDIRGPSYLDRGRVRACLLLPFGTEQTGGGLFGLGKELRRCRILRTVVKIDKVAGKPEIKVTFAVDKYGGESIRPKWPCTRPRTPRCAAFITKSAENRS